MNPIHYPRADLAVQEFVQQQLRRLDGALREATLDVFGALGSTSARDLMWQVTDDDAMGGGGQLQPPWYQQNLKRGETIPVYQTEQQLRYIRDRSRILCFYNEFALAGIANRRNYIVGGAGLKFSAQPVRAARRDKRAHKLAGQVQEFIDLFCGVNNVKAMTGETMNRWDEDGEAIVRLFPGDEGIPRARFVEPEHLKAPGGDQWSPALSFGVETDPHDVLDRKAYWIVEDPLTDAWEPVRVPEKEVAHSTLNVKMNSKRGLPTFFPVEQNLRRCEDLLASMTSMAKARAKIALIRKMTGTTSDVAANMLAALSNIRVNDPVTGDTLNVERLRYGSVLTTGANTTYEFPDVGQSTGAASFVEVLQAELRSVAVRVQMPEWMFTGLANEKFSNAFVAEATATKSFGDLQTKLGGFWAEEKYGPRRSILWRAVAMAVEEGLLDPDCLTLVDIVAKGPTLEARDKSAEATANKTYSEMGIKSDDTIADEQGLDAETEQANLAKQRERKRKDGRKDFAKDVLQIQKDFYAGALPRPAACALLESMEFTREEATALLPTEAGVDRTAAGRQQKEQFEQQQAAMGGASGAPDNPLAALMGGGPGGDTGPESGDSGVPSGPSPSGAPGGGDTPVTESYRVEGFMRGGLGLVEQVSSDLLGMRLTQRETLILLEQGFTGTVTAKNGAVFYYVDGKRVANPHGKQSAGKPLGSHHTHEIAKAHQSKAKEAAALATSDPDKLTPAHMDALAVSLAVLPVAELRDMAKKFGASVKGKLKDDVVAAVAGMFPLPGKDGAVPDLSDTSLDKTDAAGDTSDMSNVADDGKSAEEASLRAMHDAREYDSGKVARTLQAILDRDGADEVRAVAERMGVKGVRTLPVKHAVWGIKELLGDRDGERRAEQHEQGAGAGSSDLKSGQDAPAPVPETPAPTDAVRAAVSEAIARSAAEVDPAVHNHENHEVRVPFAEVRAKLAAAGVTDRAAQDEAILDATHRDPASKDKVRLAPPRGASAGTDEERANQLKGMGYDAFGALTVKPEHYGHWTGDADVAPTDAEARDAAHGPTDRAPADQEPEPAGVKADAPSTDHAAAIAGLIDRNKKLKKNHAYIADKVKKYAAANMTPADAAALEAKAGVKLGNDLGLNINELHAATRGETPAASAPQPGAPAAPAPAPALAATHSAPLPKNRKGMTIDTAGEALRQMGYTLGSQQVDLARGETMYDVTTPDGKQITMSVGKVRDLVYGSAAGGDPSKRKAPSTKPPEPTPAAGALDHADPPALAGAMKTAGQSLPSWNNRPFDPSAGSWASHKVLISDLYDAMSPRMPGVGLDEFKSRLVADHKHALHRNDLPQVARDIGAVKRSSTANHLGMPDSYHVVDVTQLRGDAPAPAEPAPAPAEPAAMADLYHRAASADTAEVDAAADQLKAMPKADLAKVATAIGFIHPAGVSAAKLAADLHARIADRHGVAIRRKLINPADRPPGKGN